MSRTHFNRIAAKWDETRWSGDDMTKLERVAKRLDIRPGSTVLDVGTGTGAFIPFLVSEIGEGGRIVALDFAEKMLRQARAKGFNGNIDYLHADVISLPLHEAIFDVVVCFDCFPHFRDKPGALAEMNRIIKSGGRLLICHSSSRVSINEIHRQIPAVENDIIPDEGEMQLMLLMAGFAEIRIDDNSESYLASARKSK